MMKWDTSGISEGVGEAGHSVDSSAEESDDGEAPLTTEIK